MESAKRALLFAAGLFLTIALIVMFVVMFVSAQDASKTAQNSFSDIQTELSATQFTIYDNTNVSGSQVVNALRKFYMKDQFGVIVVTGKDKNKNNKEGTLYTSENNYKEGFLNSLPTDHKYSSYKKSITDVTNESSDAYVNPSGKFKANIIYDDNNVVRLIKFEQK